MAKTGKLRAFFDNLFKEETVIRKTRLAAILDFIYDMSVLSAVTIIFIIIMTLIF